VENAVQANVKALLHNDLNKHEVFNVACGEQTSLLEIIDILGRVTGKNMVVKHGPERPGDVKHSLANISKLKDVLGYEPTIYFEEGLKKVYEWYMNN
jgi:UDP-N-acetylglucosamine 4-epimerase